MKCIVLFSELHTNNKEKYQKFLLTKLLQKVKRAYFYINCDPRKTQTHKETFL